MVRRCCCSSDIASSSAPYVTTTPDAELTNEQALSVLGTGLLKNAAGTGILSIATAGVDYAVPSHEHDVNPMQPQGRLTLATGNPTPATDLTAQTTLYYTPHIGEQLTLFDGTEWDLYTFAELSITNASLAANTNYDVFIYDNTGTLTLELTAWASDTARTTAIVKQNGFYVKSGQSGRLYLGTIRTTGATQFEDSFNNGASAMRAFVWNYYHRAWKNMSKGIASPHNYNAGTYRSWNADDTLRLEYVIGVIEESILFNLEGEINAAVDGTGNAIAIGINITNGRTSNPASNLSAQTNTVNIAFSYIPSLGYSFAQVVQSGAAPNPFFVYAHIYADFPR